ncbi:MAG TPA: hypothetical protein VK476_05330 [Flavobacterium sp.]|nr:hypothetical protein [Flavobacterium sp.]
MKTKTQSPKGNQEETAQQTLKRKWQIALRRYILEDNPSVNYAPYFGLPAFHLKKWIEIQFKANMNWENFGKAWSLTQKIPVYLFNLTDEKELALCWNFINIAVLDLHDTGGLANMEFAAKQFFADLLATTGHQKCKEMLDKIMQVEATHVKNVKPFESFIRERAEMIEMLGEFDSENFARVNRGEEIKAILMEKEIIKKYGS